MHAPTLSLNILVVVAQSSVRQRSARSTPPRRRRRWLSELSHWKSYLEQHWNTLQLSGDFIWPYHTAYLTLTRWCSGRALDSWSRGRGFDSDRGIIRATTLGKLFTPNVPLFTKQYTWYLTRAFMLNASYYWQRHRVQWTRGYCRAVLRWFTNCIEPRYKSSALSLPYHEIHQFIITAETFLCEFEQTFVCSSYKGKRQHNIGNKTLWAFQIFVALQHNRFMAEAREKEPEVVLIGDTHIQRLAQHEVCDCVLCVFVTL